METVLKTMRLDKEVLAAFIKLCESKKERPAAVVQRMMLDAAKRGGFWKK